MLVQNQIVVIRRCDWFTTKTANVETNVVKERSPCFIYRSHRLCHGVLELSSSHAADGSSFRLNYDID